MHQISLRVSLKQRHMAKSLSRLTHYSMGNETGYVEIPDMFPPTGIQFIGYSDWGRNLQVWYVQTRVPLCWVTRRKHIAPWSYMLIVTLLRSNLANTASLIWHALQSMPEPSNHANWAGKGVVDPKRPGVFGLEIQNKEI